MTAPATPPAEEAPAPASSDLRMTHVLPGPPDVAWRCCTEAELLKQWFTPAPVEITEALVEARAGGRFFTRMRLPDGTQIDSEGCILAADPGRLLAFTDALCAGFRPNEASFMTAILTFDPIPEGTLYTATVLHASPESRARHEEMGFEEGWGTAARQLAALVAKVKA